MSKQFVIFFIILNFASQVWGALTLDERIDQEAARRLDTFFDPEHDYSKFKGRVTDKDDTLTILKIETENKNIKFLKAGDEVSFTIASLADKRSCQSFLRAIEPGYLTVYVNNLYPCTLKDSLFRRGTLLNLESKILATRVKEASFYRASLITKKKNFLTQLSQVNNQLFTYDQERLKIAADYDKQILEIEKAKARELEQLFVTKRDKVVLQRELEVKLNDIDTDLSFYIVDPTDNVLDRWSKDHYVGLPMEDRPSTPKLK